MGSKEGADSLNQRLIGGFFYGLVARATDNPETSIFTEGIYYAQAGLSSSLTISSRVQIRLVKPEAIAGVTPIEPFGLRVL